MDSTQHPLSPECQSLLTYLWSVTTNPDRWALSVAQTADALDLTMAQIEPRIEELVSKGYLKRRWRDGIDVTDRGRRAAKRGAPSP